MKVLSSRWLLSAFWDTTSMCLIDWKILPVKAGEHKVEKRKKCSTSENLLRSWLGQRGEYPLEHRWQTQGLRAESGPPGFIPLAGPCFYPAAAPNSQLLRSSYIYTVLKLHSALWRQLRGWCGPRWKWVWHPNVKASKLKFNQKSGESYFINSNEVKNC